MRNVVILMTAILSAAPLAAQSTAKGPLVDRIQLETRPLEDACLKEVAAGRADLCASLVGSAALATLPDEARAGLDIFPVTGTGTLSLLLNPWPDRAPFTTTDRDGRVRFNPLAIRDVRFALNILIDRSRIIGDSLAGAGQPQLIPVGPGLPDASRWAAIPMRLGVTATGDEGRAIEAITAAMSAAAALPENAGRLVRGAPWWTFDGEPVTLRFVIRNDDQDVRLGVGRAVADSIERTGIRVERMEMGRAAARRLWAQSDPRERLWDLYTEAWSGRTVTAWLDGIATDMYAPRGGNMTGAGIPGAWAYADPDVDALSVAAAGAANATEYAARLSDLLTRGLESSVRIFIAARTSFIVANKGREAGRMIVGPADGMNAWSLATFDLRPQKDASLRMIAVAPAGSLATSPWDPIGAGGFTDEGSALLVDAVSDRETEPNPVTGTDMPIWASWSRVKSSIVAGVNGAPVGKIAVPPTAVLWNAKRGAWEKGIVFGPADDASGAWGYRPAASITACSQATFAFRSGEWHDGRLIDINDYRYALSLPWDVAFRSGDDDRLYDADYAAARGAVLSRYKGFVFDRDGTITAYGDAVFPSDQGHLAALLCPRLAVGASGVGVAVPWEVLEAVRSIVTDGGASKTAWSIGVNPDLTEVDLLDPRCAADIAARLDELAEAARVPPALKGYVTPAQATAGYRLARDFIRAHGHAVISNGPFILDAYDPSTGAGTLVANRDPSYPFPRGYWSRQLAATLPAIDALDVTPVAANTPVTVTVTLRATAFPAGTTKPADLARVKVTLLGKTPTTYTAGLVTAGTYRTVIPARDVAALGSGTWTIRAEATLGTVVTNKWGTTAVATAQLVVE